ncbi:MAG TPA: cytochrome c oxidase subunit II [Pirellulales bacterium]|nr:cytochrome c oxidase subunit II [Pirellulales bacterium]
MFAQLPLFPEQASAIAPRIDSLLFFLLAVTGTVALGVFVLVVYFSIRYRRRPSNLATPRITGSTWLEIFWSTAPFLIFLVMFAWGAQIYFALAQPPKDALDLYVVGKQWMWKVQHPEGQREINEVHVPLGQPVKLTLTSEDVIHDFFVPAFRTKIDVLPGRYVYTWFTPTAVGRYHLFCSQYCGTNHAGMQGTVEVMPPADYEQWLNLHAEGSLALEGRKLFLKLQCITCHSANAQARAPLLENLYDQLVPLRGGGAVVADDNYLRESILNPQAKVVLGWEPIMPTFQGQVTEEDLIKLIAFIKSLVTGQTPVRTEEALPPPTNPVGVTNPAPGVNQPGVVQPSNSLPSATQPPALPAARNSR